MLITGGMGTIAQGLKKTLEKSGYSVVALGKNEYDVTFEANAQYYMKKYHPDILVNNAGVIYPGSIVDGSVRDWMETLYVNLVGAYYASRYAIRYGCRKIINIGSSSSLDARYPMWSSYNVSKAGLVALTRSLDLEGVYAVCVSPGRTDTPLRDKTHPTDEPGERLSVDELCREILLCIQRIEQLSGMEVVVKKLPHGGGVYVYNRTCRVDWGNRWIH